MLVLYEKYRRKGNIFYVFYSKIWILFQLFIALQPLCMNHS